MRFRLARSGRRAITAAALALGALAACARPGPAPPPTVSSVDLARYAGTWYELASFSMRFQRGCVATRATYSLRDDGRIRVVNECRDERLDGELRRIEGVAWPLDGTNARLAVRFFWPFTGDYWVVALDPEYRWAVVGHPERRYLWLLSREPHVAPAVYEEMVERARALGFDVARLERTPQPPPQ